MTKITVTTTITTPLPTVWNVLWNPEHIIHWGFASDEWYCPSAKGLTPKIGEIFTTRMEARDGSFGFDMTGQYTEVIPMKQLSYTLGEMTETFQDSGRRVDITLDETPEGVRVTQVFDVEDENSLNMQRAGGQAILDNMKKYSESL